MSTNKLSGKIALVTGGTSGIGLATAKRFVSEGAHVFITGRRQTELDAAANELGSNATAVRSDVANLAELLADRYKISRTEQDLLAYDSHLKAATAWRAGFYDDLVIEYLGLKADNNVRADTSLDKLGKLKPSFAADGTEGYDADGHDDAACADFPQPFAKCAARTAACVHSAACVRRRRHAYRFARTD